MKNKRFTIDERIEYYEQQIIDASAKLAKAVERLHVLRDQQRSQEWKTWTEDYPADEQNSKAYYGVD